MTYFHLAIYPGHLFQTNLFGLPPLPWPSPCLHAMLPTLVYSLPSGLCSPPTLQGPALDHHLHGASLGSSGRTPLLILSAYPQPSPCVTESLVFNYMLSAAVCHWLPKYVWPLSQASCVLEIRAMKKASDIMEEPVTSVCLLVLAFALAWALLSLL